MLYQSVVFDHSCHFVLFILFYPSGRLRGFVLFILFYPSDRLRGGPN